MNFYVEADTFGTWRGDVEVTKKEIAKIREDRATFLLENKGKKPKTTLRQDILDKAKSNAQTLAHQDSWRLSDTTFSGSEVFKVEDKKGYVLYEN